MTLTAKKREARPAKYAIKDRRTKVYRALYGYPVNDDKGSPETNETRKLPEDFNFAHADSVFASLAETQVTLEDGRKVEVSNGLFPAQRYELLKRRLETLRRFRKT